MKTFFDGGRVAWRPALMGPVWVLLTFSGEAAEDGVHDRFELSPFLVTASVTPKNADDYTVHASGLEGDAIIRRPDPNLGAQLARLPGVQETGFSPGAGRPIIRGFGGQRVQLLQDGMQLVDVSAVGMDHAVAHSGLFARQVEVLRGPATLLYGGNAIGGVVNILDEAAPGAPATSALAGAAGARHDGATGGWTGGLRATAGGSGFALRTTVTLEDHGDYRVPNAFLRESDPHTEEDASGSHHLAGESRLENTFFSREQYQLGGSWFYRDKRIAFSVARFDSRYGVPGHFHGHSHADDHDHDPADDHGAHGEVERVRIEARSERVAGLADVPLENGILVRSRLMVTHSDYAHTEWEADEAAALFGRETTELRNEWTYDPGGRWEGIFGLHLVRDSLETEGAHALTPPLKTRQLGLFWLLEDRQRDSGDLTWQHGVRLDYQRVATDGRTRHSGWAASIASGVKWQASPRDEVSAQLSLSQRLPSGLELHADGPHLAAGRYEVGNPRLNEETALGLDLTYRKQLGPVDLLAAGFVYWFSGYIHERPSLSEREGLPVYHYAQDDARIGGMEVEAVLHLLEGPAWRAHMTAGGDWARFDSSAAGAPLPRNPPARAWVTFHLERSAVSADVAVRRVFSQRHLASFETPTDGFTQIDAEVAFELNRGGAEVLLFVRGENLTDRLGFNHLAPLKELRPLRGRNVSIGMLLRF